MLMAAEKNFAFVRHDSRRASGKGQIILRFVCRCDVLGRTIMQTASHPCAEKHEIGNFAWPRCNNFIALRQRIVIQLTKFILGGMGLVVCDQTLRRLIALRPRFRFCFPFCLRAKQISNCRYDS